MFRDAGAAACTGQVLTDEVSVDALQAGVRECSVLRDDPALLAFLPDGGGTEAEEQEWSDEEVLVPGWLGVGGD